MPVPLAPGGPVLLRQPTDELCLAFVNTKFWRGTALPTETLRTPADLHAWCATECGWQEPPWPADPAAEAALFAVALEARETLWRLFGAICAAAVPEAADLARLNAALAAMPRRDRLGLSGSAFGWELTGASPLAPVFFAAGDLLAGSRLARVRQCANPQCRWLFVDDSKSGTRRWCAMSACGNRAKAHRHYLKTRNS